MSAGPGSAGLRWLWDTVASLRPGGSPELLSRPAGFDHQAGASVECQGNP